MEKHWEKSVEDRMMPATNYGPDHPSLVHLKVKMNISPFLTHGLLTLNVR